MKKLYFLLISRRDASALLIGALCLGLYLNSFGNAFHYDDRHAIVENPHIRDLANLPAFFVDPSLFSRDADKAMYRPLLLSTLALNYAWSGYETWSYHLLNILLHGLCSLLVWGILLRLGGPPCMALLGALFFAVHPLATEPVNYISSRSELLSALFVLGAFWLYQRGGKLDLGLSLGCFALAVLAKESAVVLPLLLLASDRVQSRPESGALSRYLPYGALALLYVLFQLQVTGFLARAVLSDPVRPLSWQLATQLKALVYYLQLMAVPGKLNVHHAFAESSPADLAVLACAAALGSLLWCGLRRRAGRPHFPLGLAWIFLALLPTLVVPLNVLVNEHRLYLPLAGLAILLSGLESLEEIPGLLWGAPLLLGMLGLVTLERNRVWADEYALWEDAARKNPQAVRAYVYMGNYTRQQGRPQEALAHYRRALELDPGNGAARSNMANAYKDLGKVQEAAALYEELLAEEPHLHEVRYNLGRTYQLAGEIARARAQYAAIPPGSIHAELALNNLGTLCEEEGRYDSALVYYGRALEVDPLAGDARANQERLRQMLAGEAQRALEAGRADRAEQLSRQLLADGSDHREGLFLLAISLFQQARYSESIRANQGLVERYPDFGEGYLQLANGLEASGRLEEARQVYEALLGRSRDEGLRRLTRQRLDFLLERMDR